MLETEESELLSAYMDRELSGHELKFVEDQLFSSAEWRAELEKLKKSKMLLTSLPHLSVPMDFLDSLEKQAQVHASKKSFDFRSLLKFPDFFPTWVLSGSLAAAVLVTVAVRVHNNQKNDYLPLESLMAAHYRGQPSSSLQQRVLTSAELSSQMKQHVQS